jgi:hypothetical protein
VILLPRCRRDLADRHAIDAARREQAQGDLLDLVR